MDLEYPKLYRKQFGYTNQEKMKEFLTAKDITPFIDFEYIESLNKRIIEIIKKINSIVSETIRISNIKDFINKNVVNIYNQMVNNNLLQLLNNQGRRPEEVYYSWIRGFAISNYFKKSLCYIFDCNEFDITDIGDDIILNKESFKRTPRADLQIKLKNGTDLRVEMQSGFKGINDVKQHKILEARNNRRELGISTLIVHFDLFNGLAAFLRADEILENDVNWITRQQMEGQTVFNIDQNMFLWKLTEKPPKYTEMDL